ncbi:hypothetical protein FHU36_007382 [Nonomuraea muscovyensis]|uniref:DUF1996 domain-containing protein n=1 Tax=Nonomuraea muscovyensis TaxID=1124761 RepID=A0A7X0F2M8_9ACTN|nr:DUF1996 domain-containing protein [Nonomuraea muscovyensis]MBB6350810.1 hypothetical protein [Nonomuraea muscovyensis]
MSSSRRLAAAVSALAVMAGGLVSAVVISAGPAIADHCEPGEPPQQSQRQRGQDQDGNDQGQDPNGQDQNQDQNPDGQDQGDQNQNGQDGQNGQNGQDGQNDQDGQNGAGRQQDGDQPVSGGGALSQALDPVQNPDDQNQNPDGQDQGDQNQNRDRNQEQDPGQDQDQDQGAQDPGAQDEEQAQPFRRRPTQRPTSSPSPSPSPTNTGGNGGEDDCADLGPFVTDFVDIRQVQPTSIDPPRGRGGSRGSFVSRCGTNQNGHNNPDNFIVAPGVSNGAHHLHDYVGNLSTDAFSTDQSLAAAGTTCRLGDRSTYFWPVLRDRRADDNIEDPDGNVGRVLRPRQVILQFRGNSTARVSAMPRFLRLITGDAKAATNGGANARAAWTCSGFNNRITTKYPLCPRGSQVLRILDFPSCWDGQNTDSANHRSHVVFPDQSGACPQGTRAIPQLRMTLTYSVPQGPSYALDAFPEQLHNPITDHADFANVMPDRLMRFVVDCINRGRRC